MTLCVLNDKVCMDLSVFREKEKMALTKNKIIENKHDKKTTPNSESTTCKLFSPGPPPTPAPLPISSKFELKTTETSSVAFIGRRRGSWCTLRNMCTDAVGRKTKAQILWYTLTYYHI